MRAEGAAFCQTKVLEEATVPFPKPSPYGAGRWLPYLCPRQPGLCSLLSPGGSLRPYPSKVAGPPKPLPVAFAGKQPVLAYDADSSKI